MVRGKVEVRGMSMVNVVMEGMRNEENGKNGKIWKWGQKLNFG